MELIKVITICNIVTVCKYTYTENIYFRGFMEQKVQDFLEIVTSEKKLIEELEESIDDRLELTRSISHIKDELMELSKCLIQVEKYFKQREKDIIGLSNQISVLHFDVFKEYLGDTEKAIIQNLPDGIRGVTYDKKQDSMVLKAIELKRKDDNRVVGNIEILSSDNAEINVNVIIQDDKSANYSSEKFILDKPLRVYKIIAYINTNLSYKE